MLSKFKNRPSGQKKIIILFAVLFIFNILLFINILGYMVIIRSVNIFFLHDLVALISAIIILGFITTRLPKLKEITDGSAYEVGYLVVIGLVSLVISYFNKSTNGESVLAPFLEMFKMLSVVLILTFIATRSKSFNALFRGDYSRKTIFWQIVICSVLAILASYFTMNVYGAQANSRGMIVMIASILGGPYIGIPVGLISGLWRLGMGGPTAVACSVSTILAGVIGSLIHRWNDGKFLRTYVGVILMFLYSGFDMFIITVLTPPPQGLIIANALYAPMTFANVLGILLFTLFLREKEEDLREDDELKHNIGDNASKISDNRDIIDLNSERIIQLSEELKEYKEKVDKLEKKLE